MLAVPGLFDLAAGPGGLTPLHHACLAGNAACVELLLRAGANPEAPDAVGLTPVHIACLEDRAECLRLLVDYGASVFTKSRFGLTPSRLAEKHNSARCVDVLRPILFQADIDALLR